MIGVDSGHPAGAEGLAGLGVEVSLDGQGIEHLERVRTVVKSPGVPREAPVIEAALRRGVEVTGELELAWRAIPNRFAAITGTNGKTTTAELLGHLYRTAGEPAVVAGNVGTPLSSLAGERRARARPWSASARASSSRTPTRSRRSARCCSTSPPTTSTVTGRWRPTSPQSCGSSPTRQTRTSPSTTATTPLCPDVDLGGCGRRVRFCSAAGECDVTLAGGTVFADGVPLIEAAELHLIGDHNVSNAMAAAAAALAMGLDARLGRRRAAQLRRRPAPPRAGRRDRRRPLRQRLQGHQRQRRGHGASLLRGRRPRDPRRQPQGRALRAAGRSGGRALPRRLPDRRGRRGAARGPRPGGGRRGRPRRLRGARGRRPARRRRRASPARSSSSPRPAPASTPSATSRSAASASARSSGPWRERQGPRRLALEAQALPGRSRPSTTCCSP